MKRWQDFEEVVSRQVNKLNTRFDILYFLFDQTYIRSGFQNQIRTQKPGSFIHILIFCC